jgi:DNA-binding SARP family transcriptional activator/predicted ATPase
MNADRIELRLLGHFQLLLDGKPVDGLNQARLQLLLAYLTLHRDLALSRQQIAFLFWPDSSEKQAFANLRKLLYLLRQALPATDHFLSLTAETMAWRSDTAFTLDVAGFEAAFQRGETTASPATKSAAYQDAIALYRGDLLPGFYDDWILVERERLRALHAGALTRLAELYEAQRAYADAIACAQRLLSQDSLQESSHRLLMRLHLLNGDRAAALRVYHTCATLLRDELGVDPSPATEELYQRLLWLEDQPQMPVQPLAATAAPLVGRTAEWNRLRSLWQSAREGHPQLVLIEGEAGIGKTRLAEEMLDTVKRQGMVVAYTRAYAAEGAAAYAPLVDLLRNRPIYAALGKLGPVWLSELSRLLPELAAAHPHLPAAAPITEEWQHRRFQEALVHGCLAAGGPLLIHFDDLQWCDGETLAWLHLLLRVDQPRELLVVGTLRPEEIDEVHPLHRLRLELQGSNRCVSIPLAPLSAAEVAQLASHVTQRELSAGAKEQLFVQTEGNPLFVVEILRSEDLSAGAQDGASAALAPSPLSVSQPLPDKVQAVIGARLAQLSASARQLARIAAVIGRAFTFDLLADASERPERDLVAALDELWRRRIIREQSVDAYDFSHDRIREVAYGEISPMLRRHLHRRVAQALVDRHAHELDAVSGQIAAHYELAGDRAQALHFNERASTSALAQFAHTDATHYLTRALALAPDDDVHRRFTLLARREACYDAMAQPERRLADLTEMMALARHLLEQQTPAASGAKPMIVTLTRLGWYFSDAGQTESAIATLQQATTLAHETGEFALETEARAVLGRTYFLRGRLEEARRELLPAVEGAPRAAPSVALGRSYETLAAVSMFSGAQAEVIVGYLERALACYRAVDHKEGEASTLNKLGYTLVAQGEGEYARAEKFYREGMAVCCESGYRVLESLLSRNLGVLYTHTGDYAQAEPALQHSLEIDRQSEQSHYEGAALNYLAFLALNMGDYARAQALNHAALEKQTASEARGWLAKTWSELGLLHHLSGEQEAALEELNRGLRYAEELDDRRQIAYTLARLGQALIPLGRFDEAAVALQRAFELHRALQQTNRSIYPLAGLAHLAHRQGELARAKQIVEQILEHLALRHLDATDEALQVYLTCVRILQATGDPRSAVPLWMAREQLQRRAATIADAAARRRFWAAPLHREVAA